MAGLRHIKFVIAGCVVLAAGAANAQRSLSRVDPTGHVVRGDAVPGVWEFDVASIRQSGNPDRRQRIFRHPDDMEFGAQNASLSALLQFAFGVSDTRIVGLPASVQAARFDMQAKGDADTDARFRKLTPDQQRTAKQKMMQGLLIDRCKLAFHIETRELPVYALVVARGGPKLNPSQQAETSGWGGRTHIEIEGGDTLSRFVEELTRVSGRPVLNKTGLNGKYDIEMDWAAEDDEDDSDVPGLFTAIREQLGLALESRKAEIEVVVVDHLELPSEN